jgi:hypothetical protein
MSLSADGVWKSGVWATTVWADGVWYEGAPTPEPTTSGGDAFRRQRIEIAKSRQPEWDKKREERELFKSKIAKLYDRIQNGYELGETEILEQYIEQEVVNERPRYTVNYARLFEHAGHIERLLAAYEKMEMEQEEDVMIILMSV